MATLVVYHNSCADGSYAAALIRLAYPEETLHFIPANYAQDGKPFFLRDGTKLVDLPELSGEDGALYEQIFIIDFSLTEDEMALLSKRYGGSRFKVLDHHDTRSLELYAQSCAELDTPVLPLVFKSFGSGAMLTYFDCLSKFQEQRYPFTNNLIRITQMVSDYDTWQRHKTDAFDFYDGVAHEVFAVPDVPDVIVKGTPPTVNAAMNVFRNGDIQDILAKGRKRAEGRAEMFERLLSKNSIFSDANEIVPVKHAVVPCARSIGSLLGCHVNETYEHFQTVLLVRYNTGRTRVNVSIRSRGYEEIVPGSARHVAECFGGTGHVNSAGFSLPLDVFNRLYPGLDLDLNFDARTVLA